MSSKATAGRKRAAVGGKKPRLTTEERLDNLENHLRRITRLQEESIRQLSGLAERASAAEAQFVSGELVSARSWRDLVPDLFRRRRGAE